MPVHRGPWDCPSCFLNRSHVYLVKRVPVPVSSCMFHILFSLVMFVVPALCTCSSWAAATWVAGLAPSPAWFQSMQFFICWSLGFASGGIKPHFSLVAVVVGVSWPFCCSSLSFVDQSHAGPEVTPVQSKGCLDVTASALWECLVCSEAVVV